ncbi:hypothetical protein CK820_G0050115 [Pan troglodytes]|uniref:Uncharacterized protein n=1 Tax=Pan troglodytes TaxID=9598 RepID=A0A2J8J7G5_PANTR|nr:hypothetical protein CK820_G0050115 [Pan troglodytes]
MPGPPGKPRKIVLPAKKIVTYCWLQHHGDVTFCLLTALRRHCDMLVVPASREFHRWVIDTQTKIQYT